MADVLTHVKRAESEEPGSSLSVVTSGVVKEVYKASPFVGTGRADQSVNRELTILISCVMKGDDPEALRRQYGSDRVEEAISVLDNRI